MLNLVKSLFHVGELCLTAFSRSSPPDRHRNKARGNCPTKESIKSSVNELVPFTYSCHRISSYFLISSCYLLGCYHFLVHFFVMEIILFWAGMDSPWRREADSKGLTVCQRHIETSFLREKCGIGFHRYVLGQVVPESQEKITSCKRNLQICDVSAWRSFLVGNSDSNLASKRLSI